MDMTGASVPIPNARVEVGGDVPRPWMPANLPGGGVSAPLWFGPLEDSLRTVAVETLADVRPGAFLAILDPAVSAIAETAERVLQVVTEAVTYKCIPMIAFTADIATAQRVAGIVGIFSVVPVPRGADATETLVRGFDDLMAVERLQRFSEPGVPDVIGGIGAGAPGYPAVELGTPPRLVLDGAAARATAPALMPVINFSVGPRSPAYEARMDDPVNLATLAASGDQLVVAAAGNDGAATAETMSAWAQMPWVLSVGGTADADGTELAQKSSRGVAGAPSSGPDVVAYGASRLDESRTGTSFAAPRVSRLAVVATAAILQLRYLWLTATGHTAPGVQLVGAGFIDCEFEGFRVRQLGAEALPVMGADATAVTDAVAIAQRASVNLLVRGVPDLLRGMLLAAARPMRGYGAHEVGAGFLSDDIFLDWLAALSGRDLVHYFGGDVPLPQEIAAELGRRVLFDRDALEVLFNVVVATQPLWAYDYETRRLGRIP